MQNKAFHRLISQLKKLTPSQTKQYSPVLIARDRNDNMIDSGLKNSQDGTISELMLGLLDRRDVLLCSGSKSRYKSFALMFDFEYETINAGKEHVRGIYHVQHVKAYGGRLKRWLVRFMEYLQNISYNYLGWMCIINTQKGLTVDGLLRLLARHREEKKIFPPLMRI